MRELGCISYFNRSAFDSLVAAGGKCFPLKFLSKVGSVV